MPLEPTAALRSALGTTAEVVAAVRPGQAGDPSPCAGWSVQDVVDHLTGNVGAYAVALGGADVAGGADGAGFAGAARRLGDALDGLEGTGGGPGGAGEPGGTVRVPMGEVPLPVAVGLATVEVLVHGWDVAVATGQQVTWDDDLAALSLAFSERAMAAVPPGRTPFGTPRPVPADAPAMDRLVGLLGRDPAAHSTER